MMPTWVQDRLVGEHVAQAVYLRIRRFWSADQGRAWPTREELATAEQLSLRSVQRAINVLRNAGVVVTRSRRDKAGYVIGLDYFLPTEREAPLPRARHPFSRPPECHQRHSGNLSATDGTQATNSLNSSKTELSATSGIQEPECQKRYRLSATGGTAGSRSSDLDPSTRSRSLVDVANQVQVEPSTTSPPTTTGPPVTPATETEDPIDTCLHLFGELWKERYGVRPDLRAKTDRQMMARLIGEFGVPVTMEAIRAYLDWDDPYCRDRRHPLGLLKVNVGRMLAFEHRPPGRTVGGLQRQCPHSPQCPSTWLCGRRQQAEAAVG